MRGVPVVLQRYDRRWLGTDVVAGVTLAAVAIPEVMGYTSIAGTPIATGLYTIIVPTIVFALLGSSRLLVVGADSATAAILASGLAALAIPGLVPQSALWVAYCGLVALVTCVLLLVARVLRLGFIGDFLSASVLIGFLTGVGIQVLSGQLPDMLGIPKGSGNWLEQQWHLITSLGSTSLPTLGYALGTLAIVLGCRRWAPRVPGALIAVVLFIAISASVDSEAAGVSVVGSVQPGFPPVGLPPGITWSDVPGVLPIATSCLVLIIAQSAATARSFAMKQGDRVDVNRDILGLSGANAAAGLTGTFVVNGSPTKTEILDEQGGRSQVANLTMAVVALLVTLFATSALAPMPKAVLGSIVFLIGVGLVDAVGLRRIQVRARGEFVIALLTAVVVCVVGVEQGIILALVLSILMLVSRQYRPSNFVVGVDAAGQPTYQSAQPGLQSAPGLIVFRYDAELFYANANRFTDDVEALVQSAPEPVRWVVLDCSAIEDVDYSAGIALHHLVDYVHAHHAHFAVAGADARLLATLEVMGTLDLFGRDHVFGSLADAFAAYRRDPSPYVPPGGAPGTRDDAGGGAVGAAPPG
ncbi:MAG: STAS domain-containing protein [Frankiales bacterium]|nr:STAS domain-containing protein [Frankiales bacterium]